MFKYGTAQRQLDARTRVAGSAPEGDISTGMPVPAGIFPVSSQACPVTSAGIVKIPAHAVYYQAYYA